jgi:hypothetical protein
MIAELKDARAREISNKKTQELKELEGNNLNCKLASRQRLRDEVRRYKYYDPLLSFAVTGKWALWQNVNVC